MGRQVRLLGYSLLFLLASAVGLHGQCILAAGASATAIQNAENTASSGGCGTASAGLVDTGSPATTVYWSAGATNIGAIVNVPNGVWNAGPIISNCTTSQSWTPTALLTETAALNSWAFNYNQGSTAGGFKYLSFNGNHNNNNGSDGGGMVSVGTTGGMPASNFTFQCNAAYGNYGTATNGNTYDTILYFQGNEVASGGGTATGNTVIWNHFGVQGSSDCGPIMSLYTYQGGTYDSVGGQCAGIGSQTNQTNLTIAYNIITQMEQGMKFYEGCTSFPCAQNTVYLLDNVNIYNNDISYIHRIGMEGQQVPYETGENVYNNDIHDLVGPAYGSWLFSLAQCCSTFSGPMNVTGNLLLSNGETGGTNGGPGLEFWSIANANNNLNQGYAPMQYGCGEDPWSMNDNITAVFGTTSGGINDEGCNGDNIPLFAESGDENQGWPPVALTSAAPTISPNGGSFSGSQTVTLTNNGLTNGLGPQGNTSSYYTTDGSNPVPGQGTTQFYSGPFTISGAGTTTVKAVGMWGSVNQPTSYASGYGFVPSAAVSAVFSGSGSTSGGGGGSPTTWNVKTSWGATGNGTTNDAPAIQAGVAKISAGDTVYFPAGTYLLNSAVTFSAAAKITCQAGGVLQGPNLGTDVLSIVSSTTIGGSVTTGCTFSGGGIQASGTGGDNSQTLTQAIGNLTITYNTFENMTYATNNYRTNGGIMLGGGSNNVVIRYNTFSNIIPYTDGYNSAGTTYLTQYDPDGSTPRSAIWFYGASNLSIDHNTFSHDYQNITGCQAQSFQAQNIAIHHNYSLAHHRMFMQINTGSGCGNTEYNMGIAGFAVYANYDDDAGGPHPYDESYGFSAPFATASGAVIPMSGVNWYDNVIKGQSLDVSTGVGIGIEAGAENMDIYNNAVMGQWPQAGAGYSGTSGGSMQNNYGCLDQPAVASAPTFADEVSGSTTITYQGNVLVGSCAAGNVSLAVSLGTVTDSAGTLTATATVTTVEYGLQGVVFAIDGLYVSAVTGAGPTYTLNYSGSGLATGTHTVSATVVDAVGLTAVSDSQSVSTTNGTGPAAGPVSPNVAPASVAFAVAGNAADPINGATTVTLSSVYLSTPGSATTIIVGGTLQFTAVCVYTDGSTTTCNNTDSHGNAVTAWSSSNTVAATVNTSGLAIGVSAATTVIQATVAQEIASAPWTLTVNNAPLTLQSVALSTAGNVTSIAVGATSQLSAQCNYSDGSNTSCNSVDAHGNAVAGYTSSSTTAATVNAGGLVTGVAAGTTSLTATVDPAPTQLGTNAYDNAGSTFAGFINMDYGVTGTAASGYTPGTCYITLPSIPAAGIAWDCLLILAPTPTTMASSGLCSGRYTTTGNEGSSPTIAISMSSCPNLPADTSYWLGSIMNDTSGAVPQGFTDCGSACSGAAPAFGSGTYPYYYTPATFGSYSSLPGPAASGGARQVSQYLTLSTPALTSPALGLTVTAAAPTLSSVTLSAAGSATTLTVGGTLQMTATCHYSDGSTTNCQVADIHGNAVTAWTSSNTAEATIGAVGSATAGLVTAVGAGPVTLQATVGSVYSSTYSLTVQAASVSLVNVSLATTGGITSLALGGTNQLVATCTYSDGSKTLCNTTDAHGNAVSSWSSSNNGLATVSGSGLVTAVAAGTVTFTATADGHTSPALPLNINPIPSGTYTITIQGPITITGTVKF
jgi:hypothetical protein